MRLKCLLCLFFFLLGVVGWSPFSLFNFSPAVSLTANDWLPQATRNIGYAAPNLDAKVLKLSLMAYHHARQRGLDPKQLLTIVDYSKPSTEKRLWVVDMRTQRVLLNTWVAHGKNSGTNASNSFSNDFRSLKSSLGVFLTAQPYIGHNGYSLRLMGLERGINDHAFARQIVFHGATYASPAAVQQLGRLGRSWGCLAVGQDIIHPLVNTIKNSTLVVAYYPDQNWLRHSAFLNS